MSCALVSVGVPDPRTAVQGVGCQVTCRASCRTSQLPLSHCGTRHGAGSCRTQRNLGYQPASPQQHQALTAAELCRQARVRFCAPGGCGPLSGHFGCWVWTVAHHHLAACTPAPDLAEQQFGPSLSGLASPGPMRTRPHVWWVLDWALRNGPAHHAHAHHLPHLLLGLCSCSCLYVCNHLQRLTLHNSLCQGRPACSCAWA